MAEQYNNEINLMFYSFLEFGLNIAMFYMTIKTIQSVHRHCSETSGHTFLIKDAEDTDSDSSEDEVEEGVCDGETSDSSPDEDEPEIEVKPNEA